MKLHLARLLRVLTFILICLPVLTTPDSTKAQAGDAYALLDAVNQYRAAHGLPAYQMNSTLMIIAQNHTDYQAALGTWTHEGPGGTDETQRAAAAGYGGGAKIMCDENVAYGWKLSPGSCVNSWAEDDPHLKNLLSTRYFDAGTGATTDANGRVYYTLDVCYVVGSSSSGSGTLPDGTTTTPGPTQVPYFQVQTVTPGADGAIVHTVKAGQNLNLIAAAYGVTLEEIKKLNNLASDMIQPGDLLIIRVGPTATATEEASSTPLPPQVTSTRRPTRTPTPQQPTHTAELVSEARLARSPTPTPLPEKNQDLIGNILLAGIVLLAVAGAVLVGLGSVLKISPSRSVSKR
jgi:uncharacterized protein YkwD/LysM repeat protein